VDEGLGFVVKSIAFSINLFDFVDIAREFLWLAWSLGLTQGI
jgi:hypothetical protein